MEQQINKGDKLAMFSFVSVILGFILITNLCFINKQETKLDGTMVYKELVKIGVKFPEIVTAQAKLETGNFTSDYYNIRNNLFGFRGKKGYLYFESWKHACQNYKQWQDKHYKYGKDYFTFLKDIKYAEDSMYIQKLKLCLKK